MDLTKDLRAIPLDRGATTIDNIKGWCSINNETMVWKKTY